MRPRPTRAQRPPQRGHPGGGPRRPRVTSRRLECGRGGAGRHLGPMHAAHWRALSLPHLGAGAVLAGRRRHVERSRRAHPFDGPARRRRGPHAPPVPACPGAYISSGCLLRRARRCSSTCGARVTACATSSARRPSRSLASAGCPRPYRSSLASSRCVSPSASRSQPGAPPSQPVNHPAQSSRRARLPSRRARLPNRRARWPNSPACSSRRARTPSRASSAISRRSRRAGRPRRRHPRRIKGRAPRSPRRRRSRLISRANARALARRSKRRRLSERRAPHSGTRRREILPPYRMTRGTRGAGI